MGRDILVCAKCGGIESAEPIVAVIFKMGLCSGGC